MMDIERFTKQTIPVQVVDGFGPEEDEKAEPIAMGRQTIWGGAGKPPSRDVMQAAAKAARGEMMERMRAGKTGQGERAAGGKAGGGGGGNGGSGPRGGGNAGGGGRGGPRNAAAGHPAGGGAGARGPAPGRGRPGGGNRFNSDAQPPRENAHLGTHGGHSMPSSRSAGGSGQPDPMRTSVDSMLDRGRRGGGFRSGGGGGGYAGGGRGGSRSGGGGAGGGSRGGSFNR